MPTSYFVERQKPFPDWRGTRLGEPSYADKLQSWADLYGVESSGPGGVTLRTAGAPVGTAGAAAPGALAGAPSFSYAGAYGGIPQVPNPLTSAGTAITGNLANLAQAQALAQQLNAFNTAQAVAPYRANLPNYDALTQQASGNILSNLQGTLPPDVVRMLDQRAREEGAATGRYAGSPGTSAAYLRALGLTSLDLMNQGQGQLTGAVARTPVGPQFNPAATFVTGAEQQAAQTFANITNAAPVPAQAAAANLAALRAGANAGRGSVAPAYGYGVASAPSYSQFSTPNYSQASAYYTPGWNSGGGAGGSSPPTNYSPKPSPFTSNTSYPGVAPEVAALASTFDNDSYVPGFDSLGGGDDDFLDWLGD